MEVSELARKKRTVEIRIAEAISEEISKFHQETGHIIKDIVVYLVDVSETGPQKQYIVGNVKSEVLLNFAVDGRIIMI
jgi:hypothetical protein